MVTHNRSLRHWGILSYRNMEKGSLRAQRFHSSSNRTKSLQWGHNGCYGFSNHQPLDFYSTVYSGEDQRKSNLRVNGLWEGKSSVIGEFPEQRPSNAENVSIWWRHHGWILHHQHNRNNAHWWLLSAHLNTSYVIGAIFIFLNACSSILQMTRIWNCR